MNRDPRDWYLSIDVEENRDVIERPINDELDMFVRQE
jgi:predicted nucleotidyltransferase